MMHTAKRHNQTRVSVEARASISRVLAKKVEKNKF